MVQKNFLNRIKQINDLMNLVYADVPRTLNLSQTFKHQESLAEPEVSLVCNGGRIAETKKFSIQL